MIALFERPYYLFRSGFQASDQVQGQGVPARLSRSALSSRPMGSPQARIGNGAFRFVREHFNSRENTAIEP